MRVAMLACLLVALMPLQARKPAPPNRDPSCFRPLEEFCARDKCLTYSAEVQTLKEGGYVAEIEARNQLVATATAKVPSEDAALFGLRTAAMA